MQHEKEQSFFPTHKQQQKHKMFLIVGNVIIALFEQGIKMGKNELPVSIYVDGNR